MANISYQIFPPVIDREDSPGASVYYGTDGQFVDPEFPDLPDLQADRNLSRFFYNTDPEVRHFIDSLAHACVDRINPGSVGSDTIGTAACEYFLIGECFLIPAPKNYPHSMTILNPDRVRIRRLPITGYFLYQLDTSYGYTPLENVWHLARRLSLYDLRGTSIIRRTDSGLPVMPLSPGPLLDAFFNRCVGEFVNVWNEQIH